MINKRLKTAFTLIELLVVIAIIGILSGLIIVGMSSSVQSATIAKSQVFSNSLRNSLLMNLVSEWKFDGTGIADNSNADTTYTQDMWGSNSCTMPGTAPLVYSGSNCIYGSCLKLNGSSDYLSCGTSNVFNISNVATITFWVKSTLFSGLKGVISKQDYNSSSDNQGWFSRFNASGILSFAVQSNGAFGSVSSVSPLSLNRWYFIAEVFDSGTMRLYIDGVLNRETTGQPAPLATTEPLRIGSVYAGGEILSGYIDEVRFFNTAMSTSEIRQQYYVGINSLLASGSLTQRDYINRIGEYDYE